MKTKLPPEFYTGAPFDPVDLRFRRAFLDQLWQTLSTGHVLLTAPRRTGKTSVMDHLRDQPEQGFSVVSINVQDLTHPADFFQVLLDALHNAGLEFPPDERRQIFNRIMLDLENDFYIVEVKPNIYDFASGVLKLWWRKYHA